VVVAHRLSTIQNAHTIVVMEAGNVVEMGSGEELLAKPGGVYARLMEAQKEGQMRLGKSGAADQISRSDHDNNTRQQDDSSARGAAAGGSVSHRAFSFRSSADDTVAANIAGPAGGDSAAAPWPSLKRLIAMNAGEWPHALLAVLGALVAGSQLPLFALLITQALEYFYSLDPGRMERGLVRVATLCCGAGAVVLAAYVCEFYFAESVGEGVTLRVRRLMFSGTTTAAVRGVPICLEINQASCS
jgi:ATP-binding cassette subfamily B (MDR/TAP) protein 1